MQISVSKMHIQNIGGTPLRLEWLEDLLAVLETESLNAAAERRFVTQPAFSRRLQAAEEHLGVMLVDRSRKPARPLPSLVEQHDRIRSLTTEVRSLLYELKRHDGAASGKIVIASQHAITTTLGAQLVKRVLTQAPGGIVLRSANYDECRAMMLAGEAHLILTYRSRSERERNQLDYPQELAIAIDRLVPVIGHGAVSMLEAAVRAGELPMVAYPPDVFLGRVFARELQPRLPGNPFIRRQAETALTLAALQMAATGIGVAWLPRALVRGDVKAGRLVDLSEMLPQCELDIVAGRLTPMTTPAEAQIWDALRTWQPTKSR